LLKSTSAITLVIAITFGWPRTAKKPWKFFNDF
jgi:hypothetical protein